MNRGEVWWVATAHGRRPHLVLSRQAAIPLLSRVLAVPATTNRRGAPSEVDLDEDDGMPRECVLSFDDTRLVSRSKFLKRICSLNAERMTEACRAMGITTGCVE